MPFSETSFDEEAKAAATRALEDACKELRGHAEEIDYATRIMAKIRILTGLVEGERDPDRLKALAVQALK
jgi:hypothetical protein